MGRLLSECMDEKPNGNGLMNDTRNYFPQTICIAKKLADEHTLCLRSTKTPFRTRVPDCILNLLAIIFLSPEAEKASVGVIAKTLSCNPRCGIPDDNRFWVKGT